MNTSSNKPAQPAAHINMHIGPVFDPERYLEMERQLFKEEPRPIPGFGTSVAQAPAEKTMLSDFIDAATWFSCWLDDVLKVPFRALSQKTAAPSTSEAENADAGMPLVKTDQKVTPPPKVVQMKHMESRRRPRQQVTVTIPGNEAPQATQKYQGLREKLPGVKDGHVKHLIREYENWSDITREGSVEQSTKTSLTSKPRANENDHRSGGISGGVTSRGEEDGPVGDTNNRRSRRNGARRNAGNRGRGHRSVWPRFCGMRRGGSGSS